MRISGRIDECVWASHHIIGLLRTFPLTKVHLALIISVALSSSDIVFPKNGGMGLIDPTISLLFYAYL